MIAWLLFTVAAVAVLVEVIVRPWPGELSERDACEGSSDRGSAVTGSAGRGAEPFARSGSPSRSERPAGFHDGCEFEMVADDPRFGFGKLAAAPVGSPPGRDEETIFAPGACALCGRDPAAGFASIGDDWYCHGDYDELPTCYMRAQASMLRG